MKVIKLSNERLSRCGAERIECNKKTVYSDEVVLQSTNETIVNLSTPISIRPFVKYDIVFTGRLEGYYTLLTLKPKVEMERGIKIEFHNINEYDPFAYSSDSKQIISTDDHGLVKQLVFVKSENSN